MCAGGEGSRFKVQEMVGGERILHSASCRFVQNDNIGMVREERDSSLRSE